jgi:hypothetical protein
MHQERDMGFRSTVERTTTGLLTKAREANPLAKTSPERLADARDAPKSGSSKHLLGKTRRSLWNQNAEPADNVSRDRTRFIRKTQAAVKKYVSAALTDIGQPSIFPHDEPTPVADFMAGQLTKAVDTASRFIKLGSAKSDET